MEKYDSESILVEPLRLRSETDLLNAITKLYKHLMDHGLQTHLKLLDNECSDKMKYFIREAGATHQLMPPGLHQYLIV